MDHATMESDPYNWTKQQVAYFFRNLAKQYLNGEPDATLPDFDLLAKKLEENEVAGKHLLQFVDCYALHHDCGISIMAQRYSVMHCIKMLKAQSATLKLQDSCAAPQKPVSLMTQLQPATSSLIDQQPALVATGETMRHGEFQVEDQHGRKRRKLDIFHLAQPVSRPPSASFFGDASMPVDKIFYDNTALGEEIGNLQPVGDIHIDEEDRNDPDRAESNFSFYGEEKLPGEAAYVYSQVHHFLRNDTERQVRGRGREAIAILPYRDTLLPDTMAQSATVFQFRGDEPVALRENASFLNLEVNYNGQHQPTTTEWDFLLTKYPTTASDEVLGDSESSGADAEDMLSSLRGGTDAEAIEVEDEDELLDDTCKLDELLDRALKDLAEQWKEKNLPRLEKKSAWGIWKKMKGSRTVRSALLGVAQGRIEQLQIRLNKFRKAMHDEEWPSGERGEEQVIKQCEARMQVTVEDIEELRWKMNVWQRTQEPYREIHHSQQKPSTSNPSSTAPALRLYINPNDRFNVEPAAVSGGAIDDQQGLHSDEGILPLGQSEDAAGQDEEEDASGEASSPDDFIDDDELRPTTVPPEKSGVKGPELLPLMEVDEQAPGDRPASPQIDSNRDLVTDSENPASPPHTPPPPVDEHNSPSGSEKVHDLRSLPSSQGVKSQKQALTTSSSNKVAPIEISSDSTPTKTVRRKGPKRIFFSVRPENDSAVQVESWDLRILLANADRKRILIKLLYQAGRKRREELQYKLKVLRKPKFTPLLQDALSQIEVDWAPAEDPTMDLAARLFLAYQFCKPEVMEPVPTCDNIPWDAVKTDTLGAQTFTSLLEVLLHKNKLFVKPQSTPDISPSKLDPANTLQVVHLLDTSDDELEASTLKHKSKKIALSHIAAQSQAAAFQRQQMFKDMESRASTSQELKALIQGDPSKSEVAINPLTKTSNQELIYIDKHIAGKMKDHQVKGVQFMWRELTATGHEGGQGCVLAHTMGLGKTMQAIALLVAVNEAAQSKRPAIFEQVPIHLRPRDIHRRQLRALVICPPQLVPNWRHEIMLWASHLLCNVYAIEAGRNDDQHLDQMRSWYEVGGVLLIGYSLFRDRALWAESKTGRFSHIGPELDKYLVDGPEIVVADEAHNVKNIKAGISRAAAKLRTQARIGLTGTPMSNDVDEIYALISWAAPDYLGDRSWFTQNYSTPIKDGNSYDSHPSQVRRMLKKLAVLRERIEPKVNRADITVLRGSLKPKVEFVITMPLSSIQRAVYEKYLKVVLDGESAAKDASQVQIFAWLALLTLLTNHPLPFKRKLLAPAKPAVGKKKKVKIDLQDVIPEVPGTGATTVAPGVDDPPADDDVISDLDTTIRMLALSEETVAELTSGIEDNPSHRLSAKMSMLIQIVGLSRQCGDRVLVFSSSIPTLDYVQQLLKLHGFRPGRIDGSVASAKRQEVVEGFHKGKTNVMIISTKAGGVGLNIQNANRVVILDFGFNPSHEEQAIGRAYRLGQQKPVFVYRLIIGGTFEDNIYDKQMFKTSLTQRVVDKKNPRRNAKGKSSDWLYPPQDSIQQDLRQWVGKDRKVLDRLLKKQLKCGDSYSGPAIRTLTTIETLQEDANDEPLNAQEQREVQEELAMQRNNRLRGRQDNMPPQTQPVPIGHELLMPFQMPPSTIM